MKKQNLALAFLTSFLVALAGAVIWGLMYFQGWFAGYIALFSMLACGWCYLKFFYKLDWKFYLWNISIVIILNFVSSVICDLLVIMSFYNVSFSNAFSLYQELLADSTYRTMYIINLISNLIFSAFGIAFAVYVFRGRNYVRTQIEKSQYVVDNNSVNQHKSVTTSINALAIKKAEELISEYVEVFEDYKKNGDKDVMLKKRKEIDEKLANDLSEDLKKDIINYVSTITPGSEEEDNAIKLIKIKLK